MQRIKSIRCRCYTCVKERERLQESTLNWNQFSKVHLGKRKANTRLKYVINDSIKIDCLRMRTRKTHGCLRIRLCVCTIAKHRVHIYAPKTTDYHQMCAFTFCRNASAGCWCFYFFNFHFCLIFALLRLWYIIANSSPLLIPLLNPASKSNAWNLPQPNAMPYFRNTLVSAIKFVLPLRFSFP